MSKTYDLVINLFQVGIANIFLNGEYINSTKLEVDYGNSGDKDKKNLVESKLIERAFLEKNYSYTLKKHASIKVDDSEMCMHGNNADIFHYKITPEGKKTTFQLIRLNFLKKNYVYLKDYEMYAANYQIIDILENEIVTSCWYPHSSSNHKFPEYVKEVSERVKAKMETEFGVKIKLGELPTLKNLKQYHVDHGKISFNYTIVKVIDKQKFDLEFADTSEIKDILEKTILFNFYNKSHHQREDVLLLTKPENIKIDIFKATDYMFRSPKYMYFIQDYEKDLLEDFYNYRELLVSNMRSESTFVEMSTEMLHNFSRLMPALYEKMFGKLPCGLIPSIFYRGAKSGEIDEVINSNKLPKLIL